jgi:hypothetical protein
MPDIFNPVIGKRLSLVATDSEIGTQSK